MNAGYGEITEFPDALTTAVMVTRSLGDRWFRSVGVVSAQDACYDRLGHQVPPPRDPQSREEA